MGKVLRLVTDEEMAEVQDLANDWCTNSYGAAMFNDAKSVSRRAIMEFLANQKGATIYESVALHSEMMESKKS